MDRSEQTKKNQAINLYTWGLELLSDGGHVRDADKVGWMLIENAATQGDRDAQNYLGDAYFYSYKKDQHFTTFTPPRKLMKLVYTRPELSPLDFLRFGL